MVTYNSYSSMRLKTQLNECSTYTQDLFKVLFISPAPGLKIQIWKVWRQNI